MKRKIDDKKVLAEMKKLQAEGKSEVRAGYIAKKFGVDSVQALGAMERVKKFLVVKQQKRHCDICPYAKTMFLKSPDEDCKVCDWKPRKFNDRPWVTPTAFVKAKETIKQAFIADPSFRQTYVDNVACLLMDAFGHPTQHHPDVRIKEDRDAVASDIIRIVCE